MDPPPSEALGTGEFKASDGEALRRALLNDIRFLEEQDHKKQKVA